MEKVSTTHLAARTSPVAASSETMQAVLEPDDNTEASEGFKEEERTSKSPAMTPFSLLTPSKALSSNVFGDLKPSVLTASLANHIRA